METKTLLFVHFIMGPLLLIIALLIKRFPPRKINAFYGYRTRRSMQSQKAWDEANAYSSRGLIVVAVCLSFIQLITYFLLGFETSFLVCSGVLVIGLFAMMFFTERHLKTKGY